MKRCGVCGSQQITIETVKGYYFAVCGECGLTWLLGRPSKDLYKFTDAWEHLLFVSPLSNFLAKIRLDRIILEWYHRNCFGSHKRLVERYMQGGKLLDVGCEQGNFLKLFDEAKWQVSGIEINPHMAKIAKQNLPQAKIYTQKIEDFNNRQKFDVITLWHVFEHLGEVKRQRAKLKSMLRPGGYLIMEMPNGESIWRKVFGKYWRMWMVPQHLWFWTEKSVRIFMEQNGFEIVEVKQVGLLSSGPGSLVEWSGQVILGVIFLPVFVVVNLLAGRHRDNLRLICSVPGPRFR